MSAEAGPGEHSELELTEQAAGAPRRLRLAGIAISTVMVAAVVVWATRQPTPELPSSAGQLWALAGAIGLVGLATVLRAERWRFLIGEAGGRIGRGESIGLTVVGFMGNTVLPARGGDAIRVVLGRQRAGAGARTLIGTLLAERLLDVLVLLVAFVVLAYGILRGIDTPEGAPVVVLAIALGAASGGALLVAWARKRHDWARRLVAFVAPMGTSTRRLLSGHGVAMLLLTVAIVLSEASVWLVASYASGLDLAPIEAVYMVALAGVFLLIPSGPGYAGTLDAGLIFGVRALGGSGAQALSFVLVLRFVLLVPLTLVGAALVVFRYGGLAAVRGRTPATVTTAAGPPRP